MKTKLALKLTFCAAAFAAVASAQAQNYTVSVVAVPGASTTAVLGINNSGDLVGYFNYAGMIGENGFIYNGTSYTTVNAPDAVPAFGGTTVTAINNSGSIVGSSGADTNPNSLQGFLYNGNNYTALNAGSALNGSKSNITTLTGINDSNQIIGSVLDYVSGNSQSFIYQDGSYSTLNAPSALITKVAGINNTGEIVGNFLDAANLAHGFIYQGSTFQILNAPNASGTFLDGVNDQGQIIGSFENATGSHNFLYDGGNYSVLNIPSGVLTGINDSGQIVGFNGDQGFIATPAAVPIPATVWLLGSSLMGLGAFRRRMS